MPIRDYMTQKVITANLRDGLRQTWQRMQEREVRHMPVLDDHNALAGMISERDLRRPDFVDGPNLAEPYVLDNSHKVSEAMSRAPVTVGPDDDLDFALNVFIERRFGAIPVVEGDRLVGIISTLDMLRALRSLHRS